MSQRKLAAAAAAGLLVTALGACTSTVPGVPVAAGDRSLAATPGGPSSVAGQDLTVARGQEALAAAMAAARAIDPCALQDVAAATQATGMPGHSVMPSSTNLAACELVTSPEDDGLGWRLTTTAGVLLDDKTATQSTPEQIGGTTVLHAPDLFGDGRACRYLLEPKATTTTSAPTTRSSAADDQAPSDDPATGGGAGGSAGPVRTALELMVQRDTSSPQPKDSCAVAKDYLGAVVKYWTHPAYRSDTLTTPGLPIAQTDPCAALAGAAPAMGGQIVVSPGLLTPFECTALPAGRVGQKPMLVSVDLKAVTDPRLLLENAGTSQGGKVKPITVAGHTGTVTQTAGDPRNPKLAGGDCTIDLVTDDAVTISESADRADAPKTVQVAEVRADTCELATTAASSVLSAIHH